MNTAVYTLGAWGQGGAEGRRFFFPSARVTFQAFLCNHRAKLCFKEEGSNRYLIPRLQEPGI